MAAVAVAGGTNGLGLTIVEALATHGGHDVVVLSRKGGAELEKKLPARLIVVDYDNIEGLKDTLESNNIGTVICTINANGSSLPERNLVSAAEKSSATSRFIPSIFAGLEYPTKYPESSPIAKTKFEVLQELEKTSLTYTAFYVGMFMDYYGSPLLQSHVSRFPMFVDIASKRAAIPGSGTEPVVFTHVLDIARFVVRTLDLTDWPKESYVIGDRVTLQELVRTAEEVKGTRFRVTYDSKEALEGGHITELPAYSSVLSIMGKEQGLNLFSMVGLWVAGGEMDLKPAFTLNERFPDIKTLSFKQFLEISWKV
ncbi:NmrA-like family protein [Aspergillus alliaceus]|uniref:NmrA-like family protein n=1 Tax=Petromyces alliaceus TaxID=209559 RepID=UPI0012A5A1AB|nr:NmrA-like family protein [Aspergillus alliaceus]KAB8236597.1 NmrA-like family protein [Aspergillus alliaceus]